MNDPKKPKPVTTREVLEMAAFITNRTRPVSRAQRLEVVATVSARLNLKATLFNAVEKLLFPQLDGIGLLHAKIARAKYQAEKRKETGRYVW